MLIEAPGPSYAEGAVDAAADAEIGWVVRLVSQIRSARSELNVPASARTALLHSGADGATVERLETHGALIRTLARLERIDAVDGATPEGSAQLVVDEATFVLPLADVIDVAKEAARLGRQVEKLEGEMARIDTKLARPDFLARAPAHVVEEQRTRRADAEATRAKLAAALARLSGESAIGS